MAVRWRWESDRATEPASLRAPPALESRGCRRGIARLFSGVGEALAVVVESVNQGYFSDECSDVLLRRPSRITSCLPGVSPAFV